MRKIFVLGIVITFLFSGCNNKLENKKKIVINSGTISKGIEIGKKLKSYTFKDQFGKNHTLTNQVKKVIFVFTKTAGHLTRAYLKTKDVNYLQKRHIDFIADVSKMPSIIFKMFALPDFKKSKYPIMIIKNKEKSQIFRNNEQKDAIMIINLNNKIVTNVKFVTNEIDLKNEID